jgi:hypothetical protein
MPRSRTWKTLAMGSLLVALIAVWLARPRWPGDRPGETNEPATTLSGHRFPVQALAFAPDGTTLTSAAYRPVASEAEVTDWDVRTGNPTAQRTAPLRAVLCLALDGRTLAAAGEDWACGYCGRTRRTIGGA